MFVYQQETGALCTRADIHLPPTTASTCKSYRPYLIMTAQPMWLMMSRYRISVATRVSHWNQLIEILEPGGVTTVP